MEGSLLLAALGSGEVCIVDPELVSVCAYTIHVYMLYGYISFYIIVIQMYRVLSDTYSYAHTFTLMCVYT